MPLFALGDGGALHSITSPSLTRVQAYGALAYGARGLYYYCWGNGIWQFPVQQRTRPEPSGAPRA